MSDTTPDPIYRPQTAADYAGCNVKTILRALRKGELIGYQRVPNGAWRIYQEDLHRWIRAERPKARRAA
ncbi:helix-turn-helix domain-containing protein [Amycolatopsis sp. NPDC006131]|uniref:helix-turn-helix domain-containing protein n=1 Tax=Amycolatopsis sp. NPDC006131 TaxID=3156731 RepID=UPI0033AD575D